MIATFPSTFDGVQLEAELHRRNVLFHQNLVRSYRIAWKWQRGSHIFGATTLWLFRGGQDAALKDFTAKNPAAISVRVVEEVV